jgi:Family of unknown function (DUF6000)/Ribosomal protein L7/L12 C-terminal domain
MFFSFGRDSMSDTAFLVAITSFDPARKIESIMRIREVTGVGIAEGKAMIESTPSVIMGGLNRSQAEDLTRLLEETGMTAEIREDKSFVPSQKNLGQLNLDGLAMNRWWDDFGSQLYLQLLNANFLREAPDSQATFRKRLEEAAAEIPSTVVRFWIQGGAWRELLVASWIVALRRELSVRDLVSEKLLASATCYAGQGLCLAAASFRDDKAVRVLEQYLDRYLPAGERQYDQEWGIGALAWLDSERNSNFSRRFLTDQRLWELTAGGKVIGTLDPQRGIVKVSKVMSFIDDGVGDAV